MIYLWLVILPLLATVKVYIQGDLARKHVKSTSDVFLMNGLIFVSLVVSTAPVCFRHIPPVEIILLCVVRAVLSMLFQVLYSLAFKIGPVSLTSIIVNFYIIIPLIVGVYVFEEELTLLSFIGILLIFVSIYLMPARKKNEKSFNLKWLILTVVSCIITGINNSVTAIISRSSYSGYKNEYILLCYFFAAIYCFVIWFLKREDGGIMVSHMREKLIGNNVGIITAIKNSKLFSILFGVIMIGVVLGVYNIGTVEAVAVIDSLIFYPVKSVLVIVFSVVADMFFLKQKLTAKQLIGVGIGAAAVVLLNI